MGKLFPDPQYLIVNKIPSGGTRGTRYFWNPKNIQSIRAEAIDEIREVLGTDGSPTRKLGFCFVIPYLEKNVNSATILQKVLRIALQKEMPVLVKLDGISWWESRSDLWNWWNPKIPGYNPDNKYNVEWTGWNPNTAIKISWRNWGKQMRVAPHPNLGSQQYLKEKRQKLTILIPIIVDWYGMLPDNKKYLLAGVVLDNELSIGLNHYYYPRGNNYLTKNPKFDPTQRFNFKKGPSAGFIQLGYAAVKSYGIKESGRLTMSDLNLVVHQHAKFLGDIALKCGLDYNKIFIHGWGNQSKKIRETFLYSNVLTSCGNPGWSLYHNVAFDPKVSEELINSINKLDGNYWGVVEWFLFERKRRHTITEQWHQAFSNILNYPNNKIVAIYNWEAISKRPMVIKAIQEVLHEKPPNWLSPAAVSHKIKYWRWVQFNWIKPANTTNIRLQISTRPNLLPNGSFAKIDTLNQNLRESTRLSRLLKPGNYYYQIVVTTNHPFQKRFTRGSFIIPGLKTFLLSHKIASGKKYQK